MNTEFKVPENFLFKSEWIAALRGGKYRQARGQLKRGNDYCCLGVYCEIAGLPIDPNGQGVEEDKGSGYLTIEEAIGDEFAGCCVQLNDSLGCNFDDIADFIEGKQTLSFFRMRAEGWDALK